MKENAGWLVDDQTICGRRYASIIPNNSYCGDKLVSTETAVTELTDLESQKLVLDKMVAPDSGYEIAQSEHEFTFNSQVRISLTSEMLRMLLILVQKRVFSEYRDGRCCEYQ